MIFYICLLLIIISVLFLIDYYIEIMNATKKSSIVCTECNGGGISYIDHSVDVNHPYYLDHMNAHTCTKCGGTGSVDLKKDLKKK